jgi:hypothetical protein
LSGATYFSRGDSVAVTVTPSDADGAGSAVTSSSVTVSNSAPTVPAIAISPSAPVSGDALTCSVTSGATDADGDSLTYTFEWDVGGVAYTGASSAATTSTVPGSVVDGGETWTCEAFASDGTTTSSTVATSNTVESCHVMDATAGAYAVAPSSSLFDVPTNLTVAFWVRFFGTSPVGTNVLSDGVSNSYCGSYYVNINQSGKVWSNTSGGSGSNRCANPHVSGDGIEASSALTSAWTHVAVVYTSSTATIYLNGAVSTTTAASAVDPYTPIHALWIGREDGYTRTLNGYLSDLAIWRRSLSAAEVASLSTDTTTPMSHSSDLSAWWPMDEGTGGTFNDASGNGLHATFNAPRWAESCR